MYPMRKTLMGRAFAVVDDMPNSAVMFGTAMAGRDDDMAVLSTNKTPTKTTKHFLSFLNLISNYEDSLNRVLAKEAAN